MSRRIKLYFLLIILLFLSILLLKIFSFKSLKYSLKLENNKVYINEKYTKDSKYIEINTGKNIYPIEYIYKTNRNKKLVNNIYYYKDNTIECILPIIDEKVITDVICTIDNVIYDYTEISEMYSNVDKFVDSISLYKNRNKDYEKFDFKKISTIKYNKDSIDKNIAITTYKGLIVNDKNIELFENDIYSNKISTFIDNIYITANYNDEYEFNTFYLVDLNNYEISILKSKYDISFDSYIQGIVNNKIYLYDRDNENQYEIDVKNKKINISSSRNYVKYYINKKWEKLNKVKANKEVYFDYSSLDNKFPMYDIIKENKYYYYLLKKEGITYNLYRVDKNNIDIYKYIMNIPVTDFIIKKDYIYYVYKDKLYYYSDIFGKKVILENSELEFNSSIKYFIY